MDEVTKTINDFKRNGYVILNNVLDEDDVNELKSALFNHLRLKIEKTAVISHREPIVRSTRFLGFTPVDGNHDFKRWNGHLPSQKVFINNGILGKSNVLAILKTLLGDDLILRTLAFDQPMAGADNQSIHQDGPEFSLYLNVPLVDITTKNAPIEVWPGSHLREGASFSTKPCHHSSSDIEKYLKNHEGKKLELTRGSFLLRDLRLLHRGTTNSTDEARPMLSLVLAPPPTNPIDKESMKKFSDLALQFRQTARENGDSLALTKANAMGRVVELFSGTDRDHRRIIPKNVWKDLNPEMRYLLRYACVEGEEHPVQSNIESSNRLLQVFEMLKK